MLTQCLVTGWMKRFCACLSTEDEHPACNQHTHTHTGTCRRKTPLTAHYSPDWLLIYLPKHRCCIKFCNYSWKKMPPLLALRPTDYQDGNDITIIVQILSNMSWQPEIQVSVWICKFKQRRLVRKSMTCWLVFLHTVLSPLWWTDWHTENVACKYSDMIEALGVRQFWILDALSEQIL